MSSGAHLTGTPQLSRSPELSLLQLFNDVATAQAQTQSRAQANGLTDASVGMADGVCRSALDQLNHPALQRQIETSSISYRQTLLDSQRHITHFVTNFQGELRHMQCHMPTAAARMDSRTVTPMTATSAPSSSIVSSARVTVLVDVHPTPRASAHPLPDLPSATTAALRPSSAPMATIAAAAEAADAPRIQPPALGRDRQILTSERHQRMAALRSARTARETPASRASSYRRTSPAAIRAAITARMMSAPRSTGAAEATGMSAQRIASSLSTVRAAATARPASAVRANRTSTHGKTSSPSPLRLATDSKTQKSKIAAPALKTNR